MVALDVSLSMLAEDVIPNRLERARLEIMRILLRLDGDRIGLVAFAGNAFVQAPLTVDYGAAAMFLNSMEPGLIPIQGTDLGEALTVALDAFEEGTRDHHVLLIVTDGEDHEGEVDSALEARGAGRGSDSHGGDRVPGGRPHPGGRRGWSTEGLQAGCRGERGDHPS